MVLSPNEAKQFIFDLISSNPDNIKSKNLLRQKLKVFINQLKDFFNSEIQKVHERLNFFLINPNALQPIFQNNLYYQSLVTANQWTQYSNVNYSDVINKLKQINILNSYQDANKLNETIEEYVDGLITYVNQIKKTFETPFIRKFFKEGIRQTPQFVINFKGAMDIQKNIIYDNLNTMKKHLAQKQKKKGDIKYQQKQFEEANKLYQHAVQLFPGYVSAYNRIGNCLHNLKQFEQALDAFNKATQINPQFAIAYYNKGNTFRHLKKYQQSIQQFDMAIKIDPNHADSYINKGISLKNLKKYHQALECYDKALTINSHDDVCHYNKGLCLIKLQKLEQAEQCYDNAIKYNPNMRKYYIEKAELLKKLGKFDQANNILEKHLE